jgi:hypothetical protein
MAGLLAAIGFIVGIGTDYQTVETLFHEMVHVACGMMDIQSADDHKKSFISTFRMMLRVLLEGGGEDRLSAIVSKTAEDSSWIYRRHPSRSEVWWVVADRWRLFVNGKAATATWCRSGVGNWGVESRNSSLFVAMLDEASRAFVMNEDWRGWS